MAFEGLPISYLELNSRVYVDVADILLLLERTRHSEDLSAEQVEVFNGVIQLLEEGKLSTLKKAGRV